MKKSNILNPLIIAEIAKLGHTDTFCIADCGLPIPDGVRVVDISLTRGIPSFLDVLNAVCEELVVESIIYAEEINEKNSVVLEGINAVLKDLHVEQVSHEKFKELTSNCKCIIRTGETSPYSNIILVGGVNF